EIVAHTIEKFYNSENIDDIVVVIREDEEEYFNKNIKEKYGFTNIKVAHGGNERQDSVFNGIKMLKKECDVV
ncbi:2-C-methyl-D-erythritol 4-phosphate cytidylyltransferase, partial [Casaltella massiliensis]|nr:2-C-methyl-D-erythritol 4-phosphate cytidylyltransferase [Casaltella massiliensis]